MSMMASVLRQQKSCFLGVVLEVRPAKVQCGWRKFAAWNIQLDIFFIGKTGLIAFITVFCTLLGCQHPAAACTCLNKNNCKGRHSGGEGRSCCRQMSEAGCASLCLLLNNLCYLRLCLCSGTLHLEFFTVHFECSCFFHLRISALDAALRVLQKAN